MQISDFRHERIRSLPAMIHDKGYKHIEIEDNQEPLVAIEDYGIAGSCFYARKDGLNAPYYKPFATAEEKIYLRKTLAEKLQNANHELTDLGVELFVLDGWRDLRVQVSLWQFFIAKAQKELDTDDENLCREFAKKFCSEPKAIKYKSGYICPLHVSGGAVDLILRLKDTKESLFMGGIFDDASKVSASEYYENKRTFTDTDLSAKMNRRLLHYVMKRQGFMSHSYEWWHFDYGNQLWALASSYFEGKDVKAFYGYIEK